jgi:predicted dehydrogenase
MMQKKKYNLGVVGLGEGRSIMSAAIQSDQWELYKVCDLNEALCKERQEEFNFSNWTTNYNELLEDPNIDVIAIYTPDQLHALHLKQALEAQKHVICTKPLVVSLEKAKELMELSEKTNKRVFVGQSSRFFEPMIRQRKDYEAGRHGEFQTIDSHYITDARWFLERAWTKEKEFSWMYNFLIHPVDLICWYMPTITEVVGYGSVSNNSVEYGIETFDNLRFLLRDDENHLATISGNYTLPTLGRDAESSVECTIRGTLGTSRSEYLNLHYHTHFQGEGKKKHTFEEKHGYYFRFEGESHHAGEYQNYIEYFADCLDNNELPLPDIKEGLHTIAVMEAMRKSALEQGKIIKIKDILDEYGIGPYYHGKTFSIK